MKDKKNSDDLFNDLLKGLDGLEEITFNDINIDVKKIITLSNSLIVANSNKNPVGDTNGL